MSRQIIPFLSFISLSALWYLIYLAVWIFMAQGIIVINYCQNWGFAFIVFKTDFIALAYNISQITFNITLRIITCGIFIKTCGNRSSLTGHMKITSVQNKIYKTGQTLYITTSRAVVLLTKTKTIFVVLLLLLFDIHSYPSRPFGHHVSIVYVLSSIKTIENGDSTPAAVAPF